MKRLLLLMILICMLIGVNSGFIRTFADHSTVGYDAGNGTAFSEPSSLPDIRNGLLDGQKTYRISDATGLRKLAQIANGTSGEEANPLAGYTFYLVCDINMADTSFEPIGKGLSKHFDGIFDGQCHIIDNLYLTSTEKGDLIGGKRTAYVGLFGYLSGNAEIRNLVLGEHCAFSYLGSANVSCVGGLAGGMKSTANSHVTIENCRVMGSVRGFEYAAGIVASVEGTASAQTNFIRNTTNSSEVYATEIAAGFCAATSSGLTIENCRNTGKITVNNPSGLESACGAGFLAFPKAEGVGTVSGCINNGDLLGQERIGAFYGYVKYSGNRVSNCENYGKVDATEDYGGDQSGINGFVEQNVILESHSVSDFAGKNDPTFAVDVKSITPDFSGFREETSPGHDRQNGTGCRSAVTEWCFPAFLAGVCAVITGRKSGSKQRSEKKMRKRTGFLRVCGSALLVSAILLSSVACSHSSDVPETTTETVASSEGQTDLPTADSDFVTPWVPQLPPIAFNHDPVQCTVESETLLYRSGDAAFAYNAWPTVCRDEKGVLYTVFSGDRLGHICPYGKTLFAKSVDGGKTWTQARVINDSVMDDRDAGIVYVGEGKLIVSYFCHPASMYYASERERIITDATEAGIADEVKKHLDEMETHPEKYDGEGNYLLISTDYGETWGTPIKIPVSAPHGPVLTSSGDLLFAGKIAYQSFYKDSQLALFRSGDQGKTWKLISGIPVPYGLTVANLWELSTTELTDGRLMVAIRVENASVSRPFTIYTCFSSNGGKTWTEPQPTGLDGSPPHLRVLSDGSILMTYSCRSSPSIRAVVSTDGGETWSDEQIIASAPSGDMGYPSTVELDDHTLVTVYYKCYEGDSKTSIFSVRWKLN